MKVEVKKIDAVRREMKLEIPKDRVSSTLEEVYKDIGKVAKVKGFRPGKVPRGVLEANHGKLAEEELVRKIVPQAYQEALESEKLAPIDYPEIEDVVYKDGIVTFKASFDIRPEVTVKDYKGIKVTRKPSEVTDEELNKTLEFFKGKDQERVIDDAFAKGLGYPSLDEFKNTIRRQLEVEKDRQNRIDLENQVVEDLLKKAKLVMPQSLFKRQYEQRWHEIEQRLKEQQRLSADELKKKAEEIAPQLKESVEKDIKVYLILDKIGQLESIEVKEGENLPAKVMEFLLKEAQWQS